jgi:hypothetical protein
MSWLDDIEQVMLALGAEGEQSQPMDVDAVLDHLFQTEDKSSGDTLESLLAALDQTDQQILTVLQGQSSGTQEVPVTEA